MTFFLQQRSYRYLVTLININCKALSRGRSIRPLQDDRCGPERQVGRLQH